MRTTLLIAILLVQGFIAYELWTIQLFTGGSFSVLYFGAKDSERLAQYQKLQKEFTKNLAQHGWDMYSVPAVASNA